LVALLVDVEPVLVPLIVLLPVLVLGVSLRTCLVTASQHFPALVVVVVALGEVVVVVEVWAIASPMFPANMAAAITPNPVIRIARSFLCFRRARRPLAGRW
jgi:hypothetical protein